MKKGDVVFLNHEYHQFKSGDVGILVGELLPGLMVVDFEDREFAIPKILLKEYNRKNWVLEFLNMMKRQE